MKDRVFIDRRVGRFEAWIDPPEASLDRWWPPARCQQPGAFIEPGEDNINALAYHPHVRPDGNGIFTDHGRTVPFFLEFDNNSMPLGRLVDKISGYEALACVYHRVWPVVFSLHSAARERHLQHELAAAGVRYPVATTARDAATEAGRSPAEAVWWLHRHQGGLLRLSDLADTVMDHRDEDAA